MQQMRAMTEMISVGIALGLFLIESIYDLRLQKIWWPLCAAAGIAGMGICLAQQCTWMEIILRCLPGVFLLMLGKATKEGIGYGDGLMILSGGILAGAERICTVLVIGLLFSAVWSGILILIFHKGKKETIPFVPFLTAAMICELMLEL